VGTGTVVSCASVTVGNSVGISAEAGSAGGAAAVAVAAIPAKPPGATGWANASVMVCVGVGVGVGTSKSTASAGTLTSAVAVIVDVKVATGAIFGPISSTGKGTIWVCTSDCVSSGDTAICVEVGKGVHVGVGGRRVAVEVLVAVTLFVAVGEAVTVRTGVLVDSWASADDEGACAMA
jgi:hypothetical protein